MTTPRGAAPRVPRDRRADVARRTTDAPRRAAGPARRARPDASPSDGARRTVDTTRRTSEPARRSAGAPRRAVDTTRRPADPARRTADPARRTARAASAATAATRDVPRTRRTIPHTGPAARPATRPSAVVVGGGPPRDSRAPLVSPGRRQALLLAVVALVLVAFAARLLQVQAFDGQALAADAFDGRLTTDVIPAERGEILDRNGEVLATSVERWNIVVDQTELAQWKKDGDSVVDAAEALAPLVGISAPELGPKLLGDRTFVYLAKGVVPEVYEQIMELDIRGIWGERISERLYPNGATAGNLLGFVGTDGYGLAGVEQAYDEILSGEDGSDTYEEGARGQRIPTGVEELVPAVAGRDVQLTIDRDLQDIVGRLNDEQVAATGAQWGTIQVTDVRTGEILALADSGSVDPNDPRGNAAPSRAVSYTYEPGSTSKVISMAAILDTGVATPTSPFVVPDAYTMPNGETFHDSHDHPDLPLTLTGILAESSNTGTVMVGQAVPRQVRHDYLTRFGFGSTTGIGLPGETAGLLADDPEDWDGRSEYAVLFGQAVGVTTVQNTQVFATLANGGVRVQPHVVAAVEDENGTMTPIELAEPERVVSEETADTVVTMLESAVAEGTGGNAAVPGYRIAGKTGTAQAFEGDGVIKVVASFIGIAPADDPRIVVNVVLYDPQSSVYGGTVAAPVFAEVAGYALRYLGVPPSGTPAELFPTTHG